MDDVVESRLLSHPFSRTSRWFRDQTRTASRRASGLPAAIPPGMRAISVKVNDVIGVAGFVEPGSRVDLMVTIRATRRQRVAHRRQRMCRS